MADVFCLSSIHAFRDCERAALFAASLTQHGEKISTSKSARELYNRPIDNTRLQRLTKLPHPTLLKFGVINLLIVGCSRRFLAQITRHQNEVKFMSTSLQYSDWSDAGQFVDVFDGKAPWLTELYEDIMNSYKTLVSEFGQDAAGYIMPQSLKGCLMISATPYQWIHMIRQRCCKRNTPEMIKIMKQCWDVLAQASPAMFSEIESPCCKEGKMSCGCPYTNFKTLQ